MQRPRVAEFNGLAGTPGPGACFCVWRAGDENRSAKEDVGGIGSGNK